MKRTVLLTCLVLLLEWISKPACASRSSKRENAQVNNNLRSSGVCEMYSGGKLCAPYVGGKQVYMRSAGDQVKRAQVITMATYGVDKMNPNPKCKRYILPALCNYYFPPCDMTSSKPVPRKFCQDDCLLLKNDACKNEFALIARFEQFKRFLPDCAVMAAAGTAAYKTCIRIVTGKPSFKVSMDNLTMIGGFPVTLKCRVNDRKLSINVTWYKDGAPIGSNHPRYNTRQYRWGSRLKIRHPVKADSGAFQCFVEGPGGTVVTRAWLRIREVDKTPFNGPTTSVMTSLSTKSSIKREPDSFCELYQGDVCSEYLKGKAIPLRHGQIDSELGTSLATLKHSIRMSPQCEKYGIAALCYHFYNACDPIKKLVTSRLCKADCRKLYSTICKRELDLIVEYSPETRSVLPNCSALPDEGKPGHDSCIPLGYKEIPTTPSFVDDPIRNESCYNGTGETYMGLHNRTKTGDLCQPWSSVHPKFDIKLGNYCRNPGGKHPAPWCYNSAEEPELCDVPACNTEGPDASFRYSHASSTRTIFVIAAIMGVLLVAFLSIIVYLKLQHKKGRLTNKDHSSSGSISKSTQSTFQHPSLELKQSVTDVKTCVLNKLLEVNQGKVKFLENLGQGEFARVCKGVLMENEKEESSEKIAIKKLVSDAPAHAVKNFRSEIDVLAGLQDLNILCLVGVSTSDDPLFMVFEYYSDTDLHKYLVRHAPKACGHGNRGLDSVHLLDFSLQVASGMDFLEENGFVHRDLAARNCFITDENIVKISNLGLGSSTHPADYSWIHGSALLPVRWMSPEALNTLEFTHRSDVWSYGVFLWEVYSYGARPYTGYSTQEVIELVRNQQLLPCPEKCPAKIFNLMKECWAQDPEERPLFAEICSRLRAWAGDSIEKNH